MSIDCCRHIWAECLASCFQSAKRALDHSLYCTHRWNWQQSSSNSQLTRKTSDFPKMFEYSFKTRVHFRDLSTPLYPSSMYTESTVNYIHLKEPLFGLTGSCKSRESKTKPLTFIHLKSFFTPQPSDSLALLAEIFPVRPTFLPVWWIISGGGASPFRPTHTLCLTDSQREQRGGTLLFVLCNHSMKEHTHI